MPDDSLYLDLLKKCLTATIYDESAWTIEGNRANKLSLARPGEFIRESIRTLRRWVVTAGRSSRMLILRREKFDPIARAEGRGWPLFGYSMVGLKRLDNIQTCMEDILRHNIPGDLIETGVWRGGSTILMRAILKHHQVTDRLVWVADSFAGLPTPKGIDATLHTDPDLSDSDFLKVSLEQVQANFRRFGLLDEQVRFLQGWFCDTLPNAPIKQLALLRLDGDMYESTMDALKALYHRVSPGGYVLVDDYYGWEGCRRAIDEFRQQHGITAPLQQVDWTGTYWQVPAAK